MNSHVFEELRTIACERLAVDPETFTPDASFIEHLGADSLDVIDLVLLVEERFGLQIPDDDYLHFATVQQAVDYISARAGRALAPALEASPANG